MTHIADNQDALLDYLYEEGDPAERLKTARHLQECAACSVAVLEFQTVRGMLSEWKPPPADLGFRIVQDSTPAPVDTSSSRRSWTTRAVGRWAQAAAAVLLFAGGMAAGILGTPPATQPVVDTRSSDSAEWRQALQELERSLRAELRQVQSAPPTPSDTGSNEELLQRVRSMIERSEMRQQRELALRLSQVAREVDTQHQADLLRIQQNFGQQQEMMEYLVRTSGGIK